MSENLAKENARLHKWEYLMISAQVLVTLNLTNPSFCRIDFNAKFPAFSLQRWQVEASARPVHALLKRANYLVWQP